MKELKELCQEYYYNVMNEDDIVHVNHINGKLDHDIFEAAMMATLGNDIFTKINARIEEIDK